MKSWSNSDTPASYCSVPEKRLLAAVLQRAITDFLTGDGDLREGARTWLFEDEETDAPISFKFICEALDLDRPSFREAVLAQSISSSADGVFNQVALAR